MQKKINDDPKKKSKLKIGPSDDPAMPVLGIQPKEWRSGSLNDGSPVITAALFTTARHGGQLNGRAWVLGHSCHV